MQNLYKFYFSLAEPFGNPMIQDALEKLKNTLKTGNEKLGIPILDPFKADRLAINVNEDEIKYVSFNFLL